MVNRDIVFELDEKFEHNFYDLKDVFYSREYIYNFAFTFRVNNNTIPINNVVVYKNGVVYEDCKVIQNSNNEYEVKDDKWIKTGNNNYAVEIILEGGLIYKNDFYLKVLSGYSQDDIVIKSFTTYGLHENYSPLEIILNATTNHTIDRVLLYNHVIPLTQINEKSRISPESQNNEHYDSKDIKWNYLGQMSLKDSQYVYKHLLFDTTMGEENRTVLYKAVIVTNNELIKPVIMTTMIKPNTMSLNTIQYNGTEKNKDYDIYGGIVGRIVSVLDDFDDSLNPQYNNEIFELIIDKKELESYLKLTVGKDYCLIAENLHIDYKRRLFNKNQTNKDPNVFEIYGEGLITQTIDKIHKAYKKDVCRFTMKLWCGDDIFVSFNITPYNDSSLALRTEKTANNIIKYSVDGESLILDSTAIDKTVSVNQQTGYFKYDCVTRDFMFCDVDNNDDEIVLPIGMSMEYFKNSDYRIYNGDNFYFINYDEYGIHIVKYDGINYDKIDYEVALTEQTLDYIKTHNVCCFDKDDNLFFRFINSDNLNVLEKIIVEKNELTVVDCSDMVAMAYNDLRKKMLDYVNDIDYLTLGNINYFITGESDFDVIDREFKSMGYDVFNLHMSVQELTYTIDMPISVQFKNPASNTKINFSTRMKIKCVSDVLFYDDNYSIGNPRYDYEINDDNIQYSYHDKGKNLIPQVGYERLNNKFFFKYSKPLSSNDADEYAHFKSITLYRGSTRLYEVKPQDVYGEDTDRTTFLYKDTYYARVISTAYNIIEILVYRDGYLLKTVINTELKQCISQKKIKTDIVFEDYYGYTKDQLMAFENILQQAYLYETTQRTMYIFSISDDEKLYVGGIDDKYRQMEQIPSISGTPSKVRNSFMLSYNYLYPLNIKNRSTYLLDLRVSDR